jgi:thioredoxin 1
MLTIKYVSEDWCGPCRAFWPIVKEVCDATPNVSLSKYQVSHPSVSDLAISSIPTLLLYKNGQLIHKSSGVMPKHQFMTLISGHSK